MKVAIVILGLLACSMAVPVKRQAYYRPAMYVPHTQRLMYVQYVQPAQPNSRSNGVATFVAGDSVATGSYVKEAPVADASVEDEPAQTLKGNSAQAVAEAYPAPQDDDEEEQVADDVVADESPIEKKPKELTFPEDAPVAEDVSKLSPVADEDEEAQNDAPQENDEAPLVVPVRRYGPPKKVYVQLDGPADDAELDYTPPARVPVYAAPQQRPTNRPTTKKPKQDLPAGAFFPINFGGTNGGAIAIANSFSTGDGGSATSHAVAYGSSQDARARKVPARRH